MSAAKLDAILRALAEHDEHLADIKAQLCSHGEPSLCDRLDGIETTLDSVLIWAKRAAGAAKSAPVPERIIRSARLHVCPGHPVRT